MKSGLFINRAVFTPTAFPAMPAHMQTEAVLLAVECGNSLDVIAASVNVPQAKIVEISRARHAYALTRVAEAEPSEPAAASPHRNALRDRVLRWLRRNVDTDGAIHLSCSDVADALCVRAASVGRSIRELVAAGLIVCTRPGSSNREAEYRLTEQGHHFDRETSQ